MRLTNTSVTYLFESDVARYEVVFWTEETTKEPYYSIYHLPGRNEKNLLETKKLYTTFATRAMAESLLKDFLKIEERVEQLMERKKEKKSPRK